MMQLEIEKSKLRDEKYVLNLVNGIMIQRLIEGIGKKYQKCFDYYDGKEPQTTFEENYKYECKVDPNKDPYIFYVLNTRNKVGEIIKESST